MVFFGCQVAKGPASCATGDLLKCFCVCSCRWWQTHIVYSCCTLKPVLWFNGAFLWEG